NLDEEALPMRRFGAFLIGTDVGGGGVHWNGDTWMYNPYDFEIKSRPDEKYGADKLSDDYLILEWGITYDELLPYNEKPDAPAGIGGEQNPMGPARRKDDPTAPINMTVLLRDFNAACKAAGTST